MNISGCKMVMIYNRLLPAYGNSIKLQRVIGKCKCDWADIFIQDISHLIPQPKAFSYGTITPGSEKSREGQGSCRLVCFIHMQWDL